MFTYTAVDALCTGLSNKEVTRDNKEVTNNIQDTTLLTTHVAHARMSQTVFKRPTLNATACNICWCNLDWFNAVVVPLRSFKHCNMALFIHMLHHKRECSIYGNILILP